MLQDPAYLAVRHGGELDRRPLGAAARQPLARPARGADVQRADDALPGPPVRRAQPARRRSSRALARARGAPRPTWRASGSRATARSCSCRSCGCSCELGLCMEPHQQNVLLELEDGWPARGRLPRQPGLLPPRGRARRHHARSCPASARRSESIFPEALADERLVYYPFVNNALGVDQRARRRRAAPTSACCSATCARCSSASARGAWRALPGDAARPPARRRHAGRARRTCARACTTSTSSSATSPRSRST